MKYFSLFSGIGAFEKALDRLDINYELLGFSEIDKYAVKSYCAIHDVDEALNYGDITKIDEKALPKDIDLITYGFPCQDISIAGKQKGLLNEDGTQTRSGLFFEALRIIEETQPKVAIAKNVKNLVGKTFKKQFKTVLQSLEEAGYNNYWQVLNAKDYGVPQNRERVFIVSIRKDIDKGAFEFPEGFPLELRLKDILEDKVEDKYYLSDARIQSLLEHKKRNAENGNGFGAKFVTENDVSSAMTTSPEKSSGQYLVESEQPLVAEPNIDIKKVIDIPKDVLNDNERQRRVYSAMGASPALLNRSDSPKIIEPIIETVGKLDMKGSEQVRRVYGVNGIAPTLDTMQGGHRQPKVAVAMRGRTNKNGENEQQVEVSDREFANAITTVQKNSMIGEPIVYDDFNGRIKKDQTCVCTVTPNFKNSTPRNGNKIIEPTLLIRKLTPKECFRLMDFDDTDFEKAAAINSNTQLYKQAGNSIVVRVCQYILQALIDAGVFNHIEPVDTSQEFKQPKEYITPIQFAQRMAELQELHAQKEYNLGKFQTEADKLICEVLKQEGFSYGAELYMNS